MNTGYILGWKFNNASGITTVNNVITEWPESLGAVPTDKQIEEWSTEYDKYKSCVDAIAALEKDTTPRRLREAILGKDNGWLTGVDSQIAVLRNDLP